MAALAAFAFTASSSRSSFFCRSNTCCNLPITSAPLTDRQAGNAVEPRLLLTHVSQRPSPGQRLDAANSRSHAAFADDLEQADVAGARNMRAAAQFGRKVAHLQYAHVIAVLLAEQRHRTELDRFVVAHLADFRLDVAAHFGVDQILDLAQFVRRDRLEVRKVETQAIGGDQRTLLGHVLAEYLAQRRVQQMRG